MNNVIKDLYQVRQHCLYNIYIYIYIYIYNFHLLVFRGLRGYIKLYIPLGPRVIST